MNQKAEPVPTPNGNYRCNTCDLRFDKPYWLMKHRKAVHPETIRRSPGSKEPPKPVTAVDMFIDGQNHIKEAIKLADLELSQLHDRTNYLSDMIAKYKKLI